MTSRDALVRVYSSCAMCTTDLYSEQSTSTPKSILLDARMKTKEDDINFRVRVLIIYIGPWFYLY